MGQVVAVVDGIQAENGYEEKYAANSTGWVLEGLIE